MSIPSPASQAAQARMKRRRRLLKRQVLVFSWAVILLTLSLLAALPFALGLLELPFGNSFQAPASASATLPPCPPAEGEPLPELSEIKVQVLNASNIAGLAGKTADSLKELGIEVTKVDNTAVPVAAPVRLQAGPEDIAAAYSLARIFADEAEIRLDPAQSGLMVMVGADFASVRADLDPNNLGPVMPAPAECLNPSGEKAK